MKPSLLFIVGPTAVGKSEIAAALARKINGEIISCDSMQVYRGMDIISSKPPLSLRKQIPHHLINVVSPAKEYNVSIYRKATLRAIKDILRRGKTALLVGGTGLYMSILIDGIFDLDTRDDQIRKRLYGIARKKGSQFLHKKLQKVDPGAAEKIHPNDTKRIVRALEVFEVTGKPISELQKQRKGLADVFNLSIFCINMDKAAMKKRIDMRTERMFRQGLAKEAKQLLRNKLSKTASCAIGIRELKGYFDGRYDLESAKELIKRNTRLYAKRQLTWFRKDKRIKWINIKENQRPREVARKILSLAS